MGGGSPLWSLATMALGGAGSPPRLDLFSLSLYFRSCFLVKHRFFYSQRSVTPTRLKF
uniref:Uncharacterized protein n=1 Tax=Triticum urartu TaxID=4572 RepID=A0A8R7P053_TRIUA